MMLPWKPRQLDIGFTSGRDPVSCIFNRGSGAGAKNMFNMTIPTHVFLTSYDHGEWLATEATEDGLEEDSIAKYFGTKRFKPRLHSVYRWRGFDNKDVREDVLRHLAELRQKDLGYDYRGAVRCNKVIRKLFPFIKESKSKQYCSENVFQVMKWKGLEGYPARWDLDDPHPYPLQRFLAMRGEFGLLYENNSL